MNGAIAIANDSACGLAGNVWSRDEQKAFQIALAMDTGSVTLNDSSITYGLPEAPFGGIKDSGYGSEGGSEAIEAYLNTKLVTQAAI